MQCWYPNVCRVLILKNSTYIYKNRNKYYTLILKRERKLAEKQKKFLKNSPYTWFSKYCKFVSLIKHLCLQKYRKSLTSFSYPVSLDAITIQYFNNSISSSEFSLLHFTNSLLALVLPEGYVLIRIRSVSSDC